MSNDHRPPEGSHDEPAFVNSADSHVVEPLDLWQERLPARLRDRAPRRIEQDGRWVFLVEGMAPKKMGSPSDDESGDADGAGHFRAGGFDPDLRVGDLDEDGCIRPSRSSASSFRIPSCVGRARARTTTGWRRRSRPHRSASQARR